MSKSDLRKKIQMTDLKIGLKVQIEEEGLKMGRVNKRLAQCRSQTSHDVITTQYTNTAKLAL